MPIQIEAATPLLMVYDVPTALAFYRDILGFAVVNHSPPFTSAKDDFGWALLRLNGLELMLNNQYENNVRPPQPDPQRTAAHKDIILYLSCRDVDRAYAYLRERGVAVKPPRTSYYGMKQLYCSDPDGYRICFQWPVESQQE